MLRICFNFMNAHAQACVVPVFLFSPQVFETTAGLAYKSCYSSVED